MQKKLLVFVLLVSSFVSSHLRSQDIFQLSRSNPKTAIPEFFTIASPPSFPVLRHHGKLFFECIVSFQVQVSDSDLGGTFETFIISPDFRKFQGPKIDASAPPTAFEIIVDPPILLGPYVLVVRNIDVAFSNGDPFIGSFLDPSINVRNSFNRKVSSTFLDSLYLMNFPEPVSNLPQHSVQGIFIPPLNFISK